MNAKRLENEITVGYYLRPSYVEANRRELDSLQGRIAYDAGQIMKMESCKDYLEHYNVYSKKYTPAQRAKYADENKQWSAWLDSGHVYSDAHGNFKLDVSEAEWVAESIK